MITEAMAIAARVIVVRAMAIRTGAGTRVVERGAAMSLEEDVARVRGWVEGATSVSVLTGAGISTDSGIPDFRGPEGVWTKNPEAEKMATLDHYVADPAVRVRSWKWRLETEKNKKRPNAGHRALVDLERAGHLDTLVTQNVDGLHQAAGSDPARVVEIHGTLEEVQCLSCEERAPMSRALARVTAGEEDPSCRSCGGILKSATISFGQGLVARDLERAQNAAESCEVILAIGTTLAVYPIAAMVPVAKEAGARVVILNGEATEMDALADCVLRGSISEILPRLVPTIPPAAAPTDEAR
jgi:NAD-dependent deacetylase